MGNVKISLFVPKVKGFHIKKTLNVYIGHAVYKLKGLGTIISLMKMFEV